MSALTLRILACLFMLLDHIGYSLGGSHPLYLPLRCIGRLAFPIFVFLVVNGFRHTSNRPRYALRLALFAVISQVPFALFCGQKTYFSNGNVFVTLLICLLAGMGAGLGTGNGAKEGAGFFCLAVQLVCQENRLISQETAFLFRSPAEFPYTADDFGCYIGKIFRGLFVQTFHGLGT